MSKSDDLTENISHSEHDSNKSTVLFLSHYPSGHCVQMEDSKDL